MQSLVRIVVGLAVLWAASSLLAAPTFDELTDLSGQADLQVSFKARDNFSGEFRYEVRVRNLTPRPLLAESLVIVLDRITNFAGRTNDPVSGNDFLTQVEALGPDGQTPDGKPYFQVPLEGNDELGPYRTSPVVMIRLRNPSFITGITPSFRVLGQFREEEKPKDEAATPAQRTTRPRGTRKPPAQAETQKHLDALIDVLTQKGVLTEEEAKNLNPPAPKRPR